MAKAVSDGTPAVVSPSVRPASDTPMPPGTGSRPANSDTTVLMSSSCDRGSSVWNASTTAAKAGDGDDDHDRHEGDAEHDQDQGGQAVGGGQVRAEPEVEVGAEEEHEE